MDYLYVILIAAAGVAGCIALDRYLGRRAERERLDRSVQWEASKIDDEWERINS